MSNFFGFYFLVLKTKKIAYIREITEKLPILEKFWAIFLVFNSIII
jgi:hypothetical protein